MAKHMTHMYSRDAERQWTSEKVILFFAYCEILIVFILLDQHIFTSHGQRTGVFPMDWYFQGIIACILLIQERRNW